MKTERLTNLDKDPRAPKLVTGVFVDQTVSAVRQVAGDFNVDVHVLTRAGEQFTHTVTKKEGLTNSGPGEEVTVTVPEGYTRIGISYTLEGRTARGLSDFWRAVNEVKAQQNTGSQTK